MGNRPKIKLKRDKNGNVQYFIRSQKTYKNIAGLNSELAVDMEEYNAGRPANLIPAGIKIPGKDGGSNATIPLGTIIPGKDSTDNNSSIKAPIPGKGELKPKDVLYDNEPPTRNILTNDIPLYNNEPSNENIWFGDKVERILYNNEPPVNNI